MSGLSAHDRERNLEANLSALFAQAYRPVAIREGFAAEVARVSAAVLLRAPAPRPRIFPLALAAAASFLFAWIGLALFERSDFVRDSIQARGRVAVREARGAWSEVGRDETGARLALGARELEIFVPKDRLAAVDCGAGAISIAGPAHARLAPSGRGADVEVSAGELCARAFQGRVHGPFGALDCTAADLDLAGGDDGFVRVWLSAGRARFEARDGRRQDLVRGQLFDTHPAHPAPDPSSGVAVAALPDGSALGRRPQSPDPKSPPTPVGDPARLEGTVRDGDQRPIEAFRVILLREMELPRTQEPSARDFAAASGRFQFDRIDPGSWTVFVRAEGFALWTREHIVFGNARVSLDVVLEPGAELAGRVVDASNGAPLAGAVVFSESDVPAALLPLNSRACPNNPAAFALSDEEGRFHFEHLATRETVLRATRPGYGPQWSAALVPGKAAPGIALAMSVGGGLSGRIERENGTPWVGAAVVTMPQRAVFELPRRTYGFAITDAGGAYRVDDLPPGPCVVVRIDTAPMSNGTPSRESLSELREVTLRPGKVETLDFLASPQGSRLTGRVLRADHTPMPAVTISIMPVNAPAPEAGAGHGDWRSQLCSAQGAFEFTDVPPGNYEIFLGVRAPMDIVRVDVVEIPVARNVDRDVIAPAGEISGSVHAAVDGRPILFAAIVLEREDVSGACEFIGKVFSDEAGAWRVLHLADGRYRVRAYAAAGLAYAGRDGVEVHGGVATPAIAFELQSASALTLGVSDRNGAPQAGVEVRTFDEHGIEFQLDENPRTDALGRCKLEGLPSGRTRILLRARDGAILERWVEARPPEPIDLELRIGGPQEPLPGK